MFQCSYLFKCGRIKCRRPWIPKSLGILLFELRILPLPLIATDKWVLCLYCFCYLQSGIYQFHLQTTNSPSSYSIIVQIPFELIFLLNTSSTWINYLTSELLFCFLQFIDGGTMVSPTVFARRGLSYLMSEMPNEALHDAMQALVVSPNWPTAFYLQAAALFTLGMEKDAEESLKEATNLETKRNRIWKCIVSHFLDLLLSFDCQSADDYLKSTFLCFWICKTSLSFFLGLRVNAMKSPLILILSHFY